MIGVQINALFAHGTLPLGIKCTLWGVPICTFGPLLTFASKIKVADRTIFLTVRLQATARLTNPAW